jgi:hypothetical protein
MISKQRTDLVPQSNDIRLHDMVEQGWLMRVRAMLPHAEGARELAFATDPIRNNSEPLSGFSRVRSLVSYDIFIVDGLALL